MEFRYKVLVIDDDSSVNFYIKSVLEAQGYDVIVAENGRGSEIFASSHCPDIILLDLGLPDMDGVAVLKKIREWSAVPVIVVSSRQQEQDKVRALENGDDDYVQKPFSTQELLARIMQQSVYLILHVLTIKKTIYMMCSEKKYEKSPLIKALPIRTLHNWL